LPCGSDIAIALHTPPHRAVSLALLGKALGATQGKDRLSRTMSALSTGSFSLPKGRISSSQNSSSSSVSKAVDSKVTTMTSTQDDM
jgi:hypothetical protein